MYTFNSRLSRNSLVFSALLLCFTACKIKGWNPTAIDEPPPPTGPAPITTSTGTGGGSTTTIIPPALSQLLESGSLTIELLSEKPSDLFEPGKRIQNGRIVTIPASPEAAGVAAAAISYCVLKEREGSGAEPIETGFKLILASEFTRSSEQVSAMNKEGVWKTLNRIVYAMVSRAADPKSASAKPRFDVNCAVQSTAAGSEIRELTLREIFGDLAKVTWAKKSVPTLPPNPPNDDEVISKARADK